LKQFIQNLPVLNATELKIINKYIDDLDFVPNTVFNKNGTAREDSRIRTSTGSSMDENMAATIMLHEKLNAALLVYRDKLLEHDLVLDKYPLIGGYGTESYRESIQILEYTKEQKYNWHYDACTEQNSPFYHRQISIVLYLKDDFEGGETAFKMLPKQKFRPKAGRGLFFPSNWCFTHCSQPVISGKKRVAVTWYYCIDNFA
tara:strand:+ start:2487 stop:3092 length:606 start_codon:yes stop_codon:yes gene_type:complete